MIDPRKVISIQKVRGEWAVFQSLEDVVHPVAEDEMQIIADNVRLDRRDLPPDERPIEGLETYNENNVYCYDTYLMAVEMYKTVGERRGYERLPNFHGETKEWLEEYAKIHDDKQALEYLERTIDVLDGPVKQKSLF